VSKPWKPGRETVELRPSRIRRAPASDTIATPARSRERDLWTSLAGVTVVALTCVALILGISIVTGHINMAPAAEATPAMQFAYCRDDNGSDCVVDGDTFYLNGEEIRVAGIDAPEMHPSRCPEERERGITATVRLRNLLNQGEVTVQPSQGLRDDHGRSMRQVMVDGSDVAPVLIAAGVVRDYGGGPRSWCE